MSVSLAAAGGAQGCSRECRRRNFWETAALRRAVPLRSCLDMLALHMQHGPGRTTSFKPLQVVWSLPSVVLDITQDAGRTLMGCF